MRIKRIVINVSLYLNFKSIKYEDEFLQTQVKNSGGITAVNHEVDQASKHGDH